MDDRRLDRIEDKLDMTIEKLTSLAVQTADNTASLREHMAQTMMVREEVKEVQAQTQMVKVSLESHIAKEDATLQSLMKMSDRTIFFGKVTAVMAAIFMGLWKLGIIARLARLFS